MRFRCEQGVLKLPPVAKNHPQTSYRRIIDPRIGRAYHRASLDQRRGMAQSGSAPALGAGGRGFKSLCPDQF